MRPLVPPGRVVGVDVARCVALVAMMATHVLVGFDADGLTLAHEVAGGRAAALFAVLAGVSVALVSGRTAPLRGRERAGFSLGLVVRALLIGLVGLLLGALPTSIAIILTYYAVMFVCALPFAGLRARALAGWCAVWVVAAPVVSQLLRPELPERTAESPSPASLGDPLQLLSELTWTGYYPAVPWVAYLLAGMAVGRCDLAGTRTAWWLVAVGAPLAVAAKLGSAFLLSMPGAREALLSSPRIAGDAATLDFMLEDGFYGATPADSWWWLAVGSPHSTTPLDLAHTIGTSLLVLGVALLLGRLAPRTLAVVAGAGAMTLSLYSLHVVMRTPEFLPGDTMSTYVAHVLVVLAVGALYRLMRVSGPLERLVAWASGLAASTLGGRARSRQG